MDFITGLPPQIPWAEYAHNTLPTSATGMSPFQCVYGYLPPLFPSQEKELSDPSVQAHVRRCHRTWHRARAALLRSSDRYQNQVNWRRRVSSPDFPLDLPLRTESRKVASRYIGPFPIVKIVYPTALRLKLTLALRVHPTFHVSHLKPVLLNCPPTSSVSSLDY